MPGSTNSQISKLSEGQASLRRLFLVGSALSPVVLAVSAPVLAQDADEPDEIVVEGVRRTIQDSPCNQT